MDVKKLARLTHSSYSWNTPIAILGGKNNNKVIRPDKKLDQFFKKA